MAILNITLPTGASICNGKQVTFRAPCDSTGVTAIKIGDVTYTLLNTAGESVDDDITFTQDALVSVLVDTEQNKAFLQSSPKAGDHYVLKSQLGVSVATLVDGKVPESQLPSMGYTKEETLSDATKGLYGLTPAAVPDDVLSMLSRFQSGLGNEYVWHKVKEITIKVATGSGAVSSNERWSGANNDNPPYAFYSDVTVNSDDTISINQDALIVDLSTLTLSEVTTWLSNNRSRIQKGVWWKLSNGSLRYAIDFYISSSSYYVSYYSSYTVSEVPEEEDHGYVNSPDVSAYPPATSDGYTYKALGKLGTAYDTTANLINRSESVSEDNTSYATYMARGEALFSSTTTPTANGTIAWQYS